MTVGSVRDVIETLVDYSVSRDFVGYDPYDALRSPALAALPSKWMRIAATQLFRRSPVNLRRICGIAPGFNPKAGGLFLSACASLYVQGFGDRYLDYGQVLRNRLDACRAPGYGGAAWGYNFPWQNRAFFLPAGTPTVVNTSFVANAMLDFFEATGDEAALATALSATRFILNDLNRAEDAKSICFSYTPIDNTRVHNANALAAALLLRVFSHTGDAACRDLGARALEYTLRHQRDDGSWPYAESEFQQWRDSFHTGFVLDALSVASSVLRDPEITRALRSGSEYFVRTFIRDDGAVRYFDTSVRPLDIHCPTQALVTLARSEHIAGRVALARSVFRWMMVNFYAPEGYFFFRRYSRRWVNRIEYMRWGQAWALYALSHYARLSEGDESTEGGGGDGYDA